MTASETMRMQRGIVLPFPQELPNPAEINRPHSRAVILKPGIAALLLDRKVILAVGKSSSEDSELHIRTSSDTLVLREKNTRRKIWPKTTSAGTISVVSIIISRADSNRDLYIGYDYKVSYLSSDDSCIVLKIDSVNPLRVAQVFPRPGLSALLQRLSRADQ